MRKQQTKPKITQLTDETIKAIDESGLTDANNDYNKIVMYLLAFRDSNTNMSKYQLLKDVQHKINEIVRMERD